ncbi:MAG: bifunctional response regulator/alkaline phosphatase family protein [Candidatus Kapabacteria bacterium]|nr:bifunctional response regulator/alkaline phosphatase family protein [Candidatus Kapabacteria bacterium]
MAKIEKKILWVDDEIELLRPHIILLEQKGYNVTSASNGEDAIELVKQNHFDLIFLDETMIGISGLETLPKLKEIDGATPIVMVTKNEAEYLMEQAIGNKIDDYLTKPVNPAQILLACKKFIEGNKIGSDKLAQDYMKGFSEISSQLMDASDWSDWVDIYQKLTKWSYDLDKYPDTGLRESLQNQMKEANTEFSKYVENNYIDWINAKKGDEDPLLSPNIMDTYLQKHITKEGPTFFFVVDCMRYDQWLVFEDLLKQFYTFDTNFYCSILPTATPYCRNSIFAGLYPIDIKKYYPQYWTVEYNSDESSQNKYEKELMEAWLERKRIKLNNKMGFVKIFDTDFGKKIEREIMQYTSNQLSAIVVNAVDMIAHSRSDYAILKEIAPDEPAYRSLTRSWFQHSSLFGMLKTLSKVKNIKIVLTTDHGSVRCMHGVKVLGDKDTSTSLRFKFGKNVKSDSRNAMQINNPEDIKIPKDGITVNNIIAKEDFYFVYPTDYHHFLNKYKDSFQHGGISMEEMIVPIITLTPR